MLLPLKDVDDYESEHVRRQLSDGEHCVCQVILNLFHVRYLYAICEIMPSSSKNKITFSIIFKVFILDTSVGICPFKHFFNREKGIGFSVCKINVEDFINVCNEVIPILGFNDIIKVVER